MSLDQKMKTAEVARKLEELEELLPAQPPLLYDFAKFVASKKSRCYPELNPNQFFDLLNACHNYICLNNDNWEGKPVPSCFNKDSQTLY